MSAPIQEIHTRLIELTRQLVDIESVSCNEAQITEFIRSQLPKELRIAYDERDVVFATTPRRPGFPLVVLAGHTDTVPIEGNFPSQIVDDVLYGRGSCDMKAGVAVMMEVARATAIQPPTDFDLGFVFFPKEELPPANNELLPVIGKCDELKEAAFAILTEPTGNALEIGCQGVLSLKLKYKGEASHSSRPWLGRNAVHNAILSLQWLAEAPSNDVDIDGLVFREVASVTGIRGGVALNVIPPYAEVDINVRYAPNRTMEEVEKVWRDQLAEEHAEIEIVGIAPGAPVVVNHPYVSRLDAAGAVAKRPKQAWTNTADFGVHDVPAINFGPGDPHFAHRKDEHVPLRQITDNYDMMMRFITGTAT